MQYNFNESTNSYTVNINHNNIDIPEEVILLLIYVYSTKGLGKSKSNSIKLINYYCGDIDTTVLGKLIKIFEISKSVSHILTPKDVELYGKNKDIEAKNILRCKQIVKDIEKNQQLEEIQLRLLSNHDKVPVPVMDSYNMHKESDDAIIVCFSDWHTGLEVKYDGFTRYNHKILTRRLKRVLGGIKAYANNIDYPINLSVVFLGDILEGPEANLRLGHENTVEFTGSSQINFAAELVCLSITHCARVFGTTANVYAVPGNHDRKTKDTGHDIRREPHISMFNIVKHKLRMLEKEKLIEWGDTDNRWTTFEPVYSNRVILTHGESRHTPERLVMSDSIYGAEQRIVIQGHNHRRLYEQKVGYNHIIIPSLVGKTAFSDYEHGIAKTFPGQGIVEVNSLTNTSNVRFINT